MEPKKKPRRKFRSPYKCYRELAIAVVGSRDGKYPHNVRGKDIKNAVLAVMMELNLKLRVILRLRFGIGTKKLTLKEVGAIFGVGAEQIRRLEARGLRVMRKHWRILVDPSNVRHLCYDEPDLEEMIKRCGDMPRAVSHPVLRKTHRRKFSDGTESVYVEYTKMDSDRYI